MKIADEQNNKLKPLFRIYFINCFLMCFNYLEPWRGIRPFKVRQSRHVFASATNSTALSQNTQFTTLLLLPTGHYLQSYQLYVQFTHPHSLLRSFHFSLSVSLCVVSFYCMLYVSMSYSFHLKI